MSLQFNTVNMPTKNRRLKLLTDATATVSEINQVIPCYNETVILSKQFLQDATWQLFGKASFKKSQ